MKLSVGRGHVPAACRNYRSSISSFMPAVCRFAVGGDMSPPYKGCFVYRGAFFACGLRGAQRRGCAAVREERALRMRRTPCGCNLVQELPTVYKLIHAYCLPLRGRRGHVPALQGLFRLSWCVIRVRIARRAATRLRSRSRRRSATDAACPLRVLRVRALRSSYKSNCYKPLE